MTPRITVFLCLVWIYIQGISAAPPPIIATDKVYLTPCTTLTGKDNGYFEEFLGIPYAAAPIGDLRFRDPEPFPLWTGNRHAVNNTLYCWQTCPQLSVPTSGNEDCLFLHVTRPMSYRKSQKPLNVIFYLHSGNFYSGRTSPLFYGSDYLMETQEVIFVAASFRLNIFGFLSTGDSAAPGNYGLKDALLALKWVNEHIGAFGGDPDQVTLLGHSSGAAMVHYLLMLDSAQGLFKNAILMSGVANSPRYEPMQNPRKFLNTHAKFLGINKPERLTSQDLVAKLRLLPAEQLVETQEKLRPWNNFPVTNYLPVIEPYGTPNAFISEHSVKMMREGHFGNKSVMMGLVTWDGILMVQPLLTEEPDIKTFNERIYELLPMITYMDANNSRIREIVDKIRFKYFGPTGLVENNEGFGGLVQMATDYFFTRPVLQAATLMASKPHQKPVYVMQWQYQADETLAQLLTGNEDLEYKTTNGDEMLFLLKLALLLPNGMPKDQKAQKAAIANVVNFAKYDCPNVDPWQGLEPQLNVFRNDNKTVFARDLVGTKLLRDDLSFWDFVEKIYADGKKGCPKP